MFQERTAGGVQECFEFGSINFAEPVHLECHFLPGSLDVLDSYSRAPTIDRQFVDVVEGPEIQLGCEFILAERVAADPELQCHQPLVSSQGMEEPAIFFHRSGDLDDAAMIEIGR